MLNEIKASLNDIKLVFVQSWLHIRISILKQSSEVGVRSALQTFGVRAYWVDNEKLLNKIVAEFGASPSFIGGLQK
jgi:hypothetical protein